MSAAGTEVPGKDDPTASAGCQASSAYDSRSLLFLSAKDQNCGHQAHSPEEPTLSPFTVGAWRRHSDQ